MWITTRALAFAVIIAGSCATLPALGAQTVDAASRSPARSPRAGDVASQDAILAALYDVISGPAGQKRDWNRMRSLFVPGARLIPAVYRPDSAGSLRMLDVEQYITRAGPGLEASGFFEREIARRTERYGGVTHVFSTYESRRTLADPAPFARGINSIQLFFDGRRWWVVTVFWEGERPSNPIPSSYLKSPVK
ncbi:MAG: hypothetical protein ACR2G6_01230 [Gemmatimonadaceae bacterium]